MNIQTNESQQHYQKIIFDGLWRNNAALAQLLGLCPLLAISNTFINALGLSLATIICLLISNIGISMIRHHIKHEVRIPIFVLIIASSVTMIELTMNAYFHNLYLTLGIFIPLIVTNCMIIGRAEAFASKNTVGLSALDALMVGLGFSFVLLTLGSVREIIGFGTLFMHADLLFGNIIPLPTISIIDYYRGFLIAALPPGAFIGLGLLVAAKKTIDHRSYSNQ